MRQFLIRLVRIYFGLGAVFGGLGILSYVWGWQLRPTAEISFWSLGRWYMRSLARPSEPSFGYRH
jgi:hypothetical protein